jgi:hypothetical protein
MEQERQRRKKREKKRERKREEVPDTIVAHQRVVEEEEEGGETCETEQISSQERGREREREREGERERGREREGEREGERVSHLDCWQVKSLTANVEDEDFTLNTHETGNLSLSFSLSIYQSLSLSISRSLSHLLLAGHTAQEVDGFVAVGGPVHTHQIHHRTTVRHVEERGSKGDDKTKREIECEGFRTHEQEKNKKKKPETERRCVCLLGTGGIPIVVMKIFYF